MNIIVWNVDTQEDFMRADGALSVPNAQEIVPNLKAIFHAAEINSIKILGSADDHNDESKEFAKNGGAFPDHCKRGTTGQLHIPETFLNKDRVGIVEWDKTYDEKELTELFSKPQVILTKDDNDVFTSPHISALLKTVVPNSKIYVTGVATEYCVRCAVIGLAKWIQKEKNGCEIVLVTDAIKEITDHGKRKAFAEFRALGVHFATTTDTIRDIEMLTARRSAPLPVALGSKVEVGSVRPRKLVR